MALPDCPAVLRNSHGSACKRPMNGWPGRASRPEDDCSVYSVSDGRYAALCGCLPRTRNDDRLARAYAKDRLLRVLCGILMPGSGTVRTDLLRDRLGKPWLLLDGMTGPSLSIAHGLTTTWVALTDGGTHIGIDAACADEFRGAYPLRRVFGEDELQQAASVTSGDLPEAAALLWSVKEAAVKALGCGFHSIEPRQVTSSHIARVHDHGLLVEATLEESVGLQMSPKVNGSISVRSSKYGQDWVSVGWWEQRE